jgi:preprotein translocase subunit SecA
MITIATNMAGRGTDIVLGGNVEKIVESLENDEAADEATKRAEIERLRADWSKEHEFVTAQGGLRIIATERHDRAGSTTSCAAARAARATRAPRAST